MSQNTLAEAFLYKRTSILLNTLEDTKATVNYLWLSNLTGSEDDRIRAINKLKAQYVYLGEVINKL